MADQRDERLWKLAQKRANFRRHLYSYFIVNAFLWAIWWITSGRDPGLHGTPWPLWVMLGWGIAIAFSYFNAYHGSKQDIAVKEFKKLKEEEEQDQH